MQMTYVCKKCAHSFTQTEPVEALNTPPKQGFLRRVLRLPPKGGVRCAKCNSPDVAQADTAPLTTRTVRKKPGEMV